MGLGRRLIVWLVASVYRTYYATLRLHATLPDGTAMTRPNQHVYASEIFALCERDALALGGWIAGRPFVTLVAPGRDGDWAAALLQAIGCHVVRGATERGGRDAFRALVAALRATPATLGLVVDGPLGPSGVAQRGAVVCARRTNRPVHALGAAARHALVFPNTWSGIYLPMPFTRVEIAISALPVRSIASRDTASVTEELTRRLSEMRAVACRRVAERA